jgi:hypothetical protein
MALMFGNLTQEFANFGRIVGEARAGNETAVALIPEAIREFRHTAAEDARYLVYAGRWMIPSARSYIDIDFDRRNRHICVHLYRDVYLGLYRRGERQTHSREVSTGRSPSRYRLL